MSAVQSEGNEIEIDFLQKEIADLLEKFSAATMAEADFAIREAIDAAKLGDFERLSDRHLIKLGLSRSEAATISFLTLRSRLTHLRHLDAKFRKSETGVPAGAELVLAWMVSPDRLEALLGDMEAGFHRLSTKHGERAARCWYKWQVVRTALALFGPKLMRLTGIRLVLRKLLGA